jgi:hypothetical protein
MLANIPKLSPSPLDLQAPKRVDQSDKLFNLGLAHDLYKMLLGRVANMLKVAGITWTEVINRGLGTATSPQAHTTRASE